MKDLFVTKDVNFFWVGGGGLFFVATVLALASREVLWGGMLPSVLIAAGMLLVGISGRAERSLVGGIWWGRGVFVAGAIWVLLHGFTQDAVSSISGSSATSTAFVVLLDVAFAALFFETTRRGRTLDRRLWFAGAVTAGVILLAQLVPILMSVTAPQNIETVFAAQTASVIMAVGVAILGGLLVFAGAAQRFSGGTSGSQTRPERVHHVVQTSQRVRSIVAGDNVV